MGASQSASANKYLRFSCIFFLGTLQVFIPRILLLVSCTMGPAAPGESAVHRSPSAKNGLVTSVNGVNSLYDSFR